MNGSEKQITWANEIIEITKRRNDQRLADEQARYDADVADYGSGNEDTLALRKTIHSVVNAECDKLDDAKLVIDNRANLMMALVRKGGNEIMAQHGDYIRKSFPQVQNFVTWAA